MKKLLAVLLTIALVRVAHAADLRLTNGEPETNSLRQFSATGAANITASVSISSEQQTYTEIWEIISIRINLSAAGAANDLTITVNSDLGAAYDTIILTQDMTSVVDLYKTYNPGEMVMDKEDSLDFAWTNGSTRTYGIEVLYRLK